MNRRSNSTFTFLTLVLATAFANCTDKLNKEVEPPADLIPRDTMVSIFVDFRLMDAVLNYEQRQGNRKLNEIKLYLHNSVLEKYGITREQFASSFDYYQTDMEVIDGIYADAITRLSMMKSTVDQE